MNPNVTIRTGLVPAEDLSPIVVLIAIGVIAFSIVLLGVEVVRARARGDTWRRLSVTFSGLFASVALLAAIVRPQKMRSREVSIAPRVVVLVDRSRSMALSSTSSADGEPRIDVADRVVKELRQKQGGRVDVMSFGAGDPRVEIAEATTPLGVLLRADEGASDLSTALRSLQSSSAEPPSSIVVVSDGAVITGDPSTFVGHAPVHAVVVADGSPPDASVRAVRLAGAAVAHQALPLRVEVACTGGLSCGDLTVTVRELREEAGSGGGADVLATGTATVKDQNGESIATIELPITLERAGTRAVEVAIGAPKGDAIPDDDRRLLTVDVARERVRVLHIAGRPTYDVRALRTWLKSDAAMDVVSFFILRTPGDDVNAPDEELALIPFPVRELFTEYLPTFDAIIFQDFDAEPYGLTPHLPAIARYVERGGGLVHVGGPNAFSAGGYAGTPLARVTPVEIVRIPPTASSADAADTLPFVPVTTPAGRAAPILSELFALVGDDLPELGGTNVLGDVKNGGVALWTHPKRTTSSGKAMPVLAIADVGDGRSIALGVDSTRRLAFSDYAVKSGGRAYDALWRGLLGWLMRDPRYEPVRGRMVHVPTESADPVKESAPPCLAGAKSGVRIEASPIVGPARLRASITALTTPRAMNDESMPKDVDAPLGNDADAQSAPPFVVPLGVAPEGAWALRMAISERSAEPALGALATRTLAVCERGGDEWADPRPDRSRLEALAKATGGIVVGPGDVSKIPPPKAAHVALERTVSPLLPAWAWGAIAAALMGVHWFARRRGGMA
jgi:uncharacterized membrane protein